VADNYYTIGQETGADRATTLIRLGGEFDLGASGDLRDTLLAVVGAAGSARIVVDLRDVRFIDSEAIGALLDGYRAAGAAGTGLRLTGATGLVRRVFDIIGMDELFDPGADGASAGPDNASTGDRGNGTGAQMRSRSVSDGEMP
jgi:anti-anti-sigma factor